MQGNSRLFREWCAEHPGVVTDQLKSAIYRMAEDVIINEDRFIELAYGEEYEFANLSRDEVRNYIRYMCDYRLKQLGLKPIMGVSQNPIPALDWLINGSSHDNFFEKRVTEYSVNGMEGEWGWAQIHKVTNE